MESNLNNLELYGKVCKKFGSMCKEEAFKKWYDYLHSIPVYLVIEDTAIGYETWVAACTDYNIEVKSSGGINLMLDTIKTLPKDDRKVFVFYDCFSNEVLRYENIHVTACNLKKLHDIKEYCSAKNNIERFSYTNKYTGFESSALSFTEWEEWLREAPGNSEFTYLEELTDIKFLLNLRTVEKMSVDEIMHLVKINEKLNVYGTLENTTEAMLKYVLGNSDIRIGKVVTGSCFNKDCKDCKYCNLVSKLSDRKSKLKYLFSRTYGFEILEELLNA